MKRKSIFICLIFALVFSFSVTNVHATNFSKDEDKYIKLCSSSNLTKDKESVCREFNDYLKDKNSSIAQDINDQQDDLKDTKNTLKSLNKKIDKLEDHITKLEKEIDYVQKNISKLQVQIKKKNTLIGKRMYSMQDVYNSDAFITYVFRAQSIKAARGFPSHGGKASSMSTMGLNRFSAHLILNAPFTSSRLLVPSRSCSYEYRYASSASSQRRSESSFDQERASFA